jgi:Ser/Thr protein kinase RdoA (MazF antagonist)
VLRVPQVVAAEPGLAVSEQVPGVPLHESIRSGELDGVRLAGRALAELAGLSGSGLDGRPRTLADHVAELVAPQPDALAHTGLPEPVVRMAQAIERAARAAEVTGPVGLVHRDVHPRQVLVDGSDVWLLDWDLACAGDPALDLANLVQHTRARLASPAADRVVEALLDGYAPSRDLQDRLPALEAFSALRLACKAARLRGAAAQEEAAILLLRAGVVLEGVGRRG